MAIFIQPTLWEPCEASGGNIDMLRNKGYFYRFRCADRNGYLRAIPLSYTANRA